jgi:hypothetical protein
MLADLFRGSDLLYRMFIAGESFSSGDDPDAHSDTRGFPNAGTGRSAAIHRNRFTNSDGFSDSQSSATLAASASTQRVTVAAASASKPARSHAAAHTTSRSGCYS